MKAGRLGRSKALGFWNKHLLAMDELYELDHTETEEELDGDLPEELARIWKNDDDRALISKVFIRAEQDVKLLLDACISDAIDWMAQRGSPIKMSRATSRNPLLARARLQPVRGKFPTGDVSMYVCLDNSTDSSTMMLYGSFWSKGGRRVGRAMAATLVGATEGARMPSDDWSSGSAVFCSMSLGQHQGDESLEVDLDSLREAFNACLRRQQISNLVAMTQAIQGLSKA